MEILRSVTRKCHRPGQAHEIRMTDLALGRSTTTRNARDILADRGRCVDAAALAIGGAYVLMGLGAVVFGW